MELLTRSRWNYREFVSFKLEFEALLRVTAPARPSRNGKAGVKGQPLD